MKKAFLKSLALAVVGSVCVAGSALAAPITGGMGMAGAFTPMDAAGIDITTLSTSTGINFIDDMFVVTSATGDFGSLTPYVSTGSIYDFQFATPVLPVNPLWTIGGYSFEMTSLSYEINPLVGKYSIVVNGSGMLSGNGFDPTPGIWNFSAQGADLANFSWSASTDASPVPEPATMLLFGTGLIGLAGVRRKMNK